MSDSGLFRTPDVFFPTHGVSDPRRVPVGVGLPSGSPIAPSSPGFARMRPYVPGCASIPGDSRGPQSARPSIHPFPPTGPSTAMPTHSRQFSQGCWEVIPGQAHRQAPTNARIYYAINVRHSVALLCQFSVENGFTSFHSLFQPLLTLFACFVRLSRTEFAELRASY